MKKTIIIGVTSSIAAYKSLELISLLRQKGNKVHVIMTPKAAQMISPIEFEKASGQKVYVDLFPKNFDYTEVLQKREVDHIQLAKKADIFAVVPATANTIAKIAQGIAENFLTTSILATKAPIVICPAMNTNMWDNPATQKNLSLLRSYGYHIVEPTSGMLACGYEGKGKLENIPAILQVIEQGLQKSTALKGKKILITAGATKEKIDDVRYITNKSTGKMGAAIADAAFLQGADILLLRSESAVKPNVPCKEKTFSSLEDLCILLKKYTKDFDYIFHTAAIGDFHVENYQKGKLNSSKKIQLTLSPNEKLISQIKKLNPTIHLFGFKAEHHFSKNALIEKALRKLNETHADAIIANDVGKKDSGFASENNEVYVVFPNGRYHKIDFAPKKEIAREILSLVFPQK